MTVVWTGMLTAGRQHALLAVAVMCAASLAAALYLQHALDWQPCPLCVLQRIAFVAAGTLALIGWTVRRRVGALRAFQAMTALSAAAGVATAARHVWVKAHPALSCGIDPLETAINAQWWVQQMPWLLKADGLCFTPLPPLLGLQLPVWSLLALVLACVLGLLQQPAISPR